MLISGPAGSGKEHVAKAIHYRRPAESTGTLVPIACAALDAELMISTLQALARSAPATRRSMADVAACRNVDALVAGSAGPA